MTFNNNILNGGGFKNKKSFEFLVQKILHNLTEDDIDEFQTAQLEGGGIALDAKFKAFQMKQIIEDTLIKNPELKIKYKTANKSKLIDILDELEKDNYLSNYNFTTLSKTNPKSASIADILKKFNNTKTLTTDEQEAFLKEFENDPIYQNIYEGATADPRTGEKIKPLKHQKDFIQQFAISNLRGVVAFHGVGSGKTLTAVISSYYFLKLYPDRKVIVISPSALLFNFLAGMVQYGLNVRDNRYRFFTYDKYLRKPFDTTGCLVIVDEAHNFRTGIEKAIKIDDAGNERTEITKNKKGYKLMQTATKDCFKLILLTGTAFVNKIYDIENLLAMVDNREPLSENTFMDTITSPSTLSSYFNYKISYYERGGDVNFPSKNNIMHPIYMTEEEEKEYEKIKKEGPPDKKGSSKVEKAIKQFIKSNNREPNPDERAEIVEEFEEGQEGNPNSFYNAEQYAANSIKGEDGINPKVKYIIDMIAGKAKEKFIIYSTYIHTGIDNLVNALKNKKLKNTTPVFITGRESAGKKDESKRLFNNFRMNENSKGLDLNDEYRILFITKAGAEGVDTKNCNNIVLFDELWNDAAAEQVIARAVRYKSHQELDIDKRYVNVIRPLFIKATDESLFELLLEENPAWAKIDEQIKNYKMINKVIDTGLSNNKIKSLPNFNINEFNNIANSIPKVEKGDKIQQKARRDKIRVLEQKYLDKIELAFKNGVTGFKVYYQKTPSSNVNGIIKQYTTIKTAYGKKNMSIAIPTYNDVNLSPFFDEKEYKRALDDKQETIYLIRVQQIINQQNKKAVLSPDLLNAIQRDEKKEIPAVDLFKFILTKSKEQRIRYFIEHFGNDITLYEKYESEYKNFILKEIKRTGEELTPELEMKLIKIIVMSEVETVSKILWTHVEKNKLDQWNKRTKEEKLQQFYTPPEIAYELADKMIEHLRLENYENLSILEPTAGEGGLLIPFLKPKNDQFIKYNETNIFNIDLVEIDPINRDFLQKISNKGKTFLHLQTEPNFLKYMTSTRYDMVITNPPFHLRKGENAGLNRDVYDIDFIYRSVVLLKVGGVLGAIIGKASEGSMQLDHIKKAGDLQIINIGKRKFGTITTPVLFLIFKKETEQFDGEYLISTNDIYIKSEIIPDYLPPKPTIDEIKPEIKKKKKYMVM